MKTTPSAPEALSREQIQDWKTHFKSQAQTGDITVEHWHELRVLCDMALRSLPDGLVWEPTIDQVQAALDAWNAHDKEVREAGYTHDFKSEIIRIIFRAMRSPSGEQAVRVPTIIKGPLPSQAVEEYRQRYGFLPSEESTYTLIEDVIRLLDSHECKAAAKALRAAMKHIPNVPTCQPRGEDYTDLIMCVQMKYPGETRHQTAKRLLLQAQEHCGREAKAIDAALSDAGRKG